MFEQKCLSVNLACLFLFYQGVAEDSKGEVVVEAPASEEVVVVEAGEEEVEEVECKVVGEILSKVQAAVEGIGVKEGAVTVNVARASRPTIRVVVGAIRVVVVGAIRVVVVAIRVAVGAIRVVVVGAIRVVVVGAIRVVVVGAIRVAVGAIRVVVVGAIRVVVVVEEEGVEVEVEEEVEEADIEVIKIVLLFLLHTKF